MLVENVDVELVLLEVEVVDLELVVDVVEDVVGVFDGLAEVVLDDEALL